MLKQENVLQKFIASKVKHLKQYTINLIINTNTRHVLTILLKKQSRKFIHNLHTIIQLCTNLHLQYALYHDTTHSKNRKLKKCQDLIMICKQILEVG